jgi:hypothetical protein
MDLVQPSWVIDTEVATDDLGVNIARHARMAIQDSNVVVLLIGPTWSRLVGGQGKASGNRELSYFAALQAALAPTAITIPAFTGGVRHFPKDLPDDMRELTLRNSMDLNEDRGAALLKLARYLQRVPRGPQPSGFTAVEADLVW